MSENNTVLYIQHGTGEHERFIELTADHTTSVLRSNNVEYHITQKVRYMPSRTPHWDKIYLIYHAIQNPKVKKVIWADADTLIHKNFDINEVNFQPGKIGCVQHVGVGGWKQHYDNWHYNTGVMAIHKGNTEIEIQRLKYFLSLAMQTDDIKEPVYWYEQSVLLELSLQPQFRDIFYTLPDKFNSNYVNDVPDWRIRAWHGIRDYGSIFSEMSSLLNGWYKNNEK